MKIIFLSDIFNQFSENSEAQVILMYAENIFLFIIFSYALFAIITTPIMLFYSAIDNFFKWKKNNSLITNEICCEDTKNHPIYVSKVCNLYKKSLSRFVGNVLGLFTWNVCSLIYILFVFPDFKTGVVNYFIFPFEVIESYTFSNMTGSLYQNSASWFYMLAILGATFVSYQLGKMIAPILFRKKLPDTYKKLSLA